MMQTERLRVALIVGTLGQGGAEKQAFYLSKALQSAQVEMRVYSLTQHEYYEAKFCKLGLEPIWVGQSNNVGVRIQRIIREIRYFRPHFIHSTHTYTNLYAGLCGKLLNIVSIGSLRGDLESVRNSYGCMTQTLLHLPTVIISNSQKTANNAISMGKLRQENSHYLPNVIDIDDFDANYQQSDTITEKFHIVLVARLVEEKRIEDFLQAFALAQEKMPNLKGAIVGDGTERGKLEEFASKLGLPRSICFLGQRNDVPNILKHSEIFVLSSRFEGFPNVIIEAMAAQLPVVTTPAGDASNIVLHERTGYVVPFGDSKQMAKQIVRLAENPTLRSEFGKKARKIVEESYSYNVLAGNVFKIYHAIANQHKTKLTRLIP